MKSLLNFIKESNNQTLTYTVRSFAAAILIATGIVDVKNWVQRVENPPVFKDILYDLLYSQKFTYKDDKIVPIQDLEKMYNDLKTPVQCSEDLESFDGYEDEFIFISYKNKIIKMELI